RVLESEAAADGEVEQRAARLPVKGVHSGAGGHQHVLGPVVVEVGSGDAADHDAAGSGDGPAGHRLMRYAVDGEDPTAVDVARANQGALDDIESSVAVHIGQRRRGGAGAGGG